MARRRGGRLRQRIRGEVASFRRVELERGWLGGMSSPVAARFDEVNKEDGVLGPAAQAYITSGRDFL